MHWKMVIGSNSFPNWETHLSRDLHTNHHHPRRETKTGVTSPQIYHLKMKLLLPLLPLQRRECVPKNGLRPRILLPSTTGQNLHFIRRHNHPGRNKHSPPLQGWDSILIREEWGGQNVIPFKYCFWPTLQWTDKSKLNTDDSHEYIIQTNMTRRQRRRHHVSPKNTSN